MKILYLGKFNNSWNTENYVTHALEQNGAEVKQLTHGFRSTMTGAVWHYHNFKPDVVLFSKAKTKWTGEFINYCREHGTLTICWQWDLFFGYRAGKKLAQFNADLVFTTDGGHPESWTDLGATHEVLRQGIHEPEHIMYPENYKYDVGFVGSGSYKERRQLIGWLRKSYRGRYVEHRNVRGLQLNEALAEIRIVVGDSYRTDNYWSNRIYEITGRGGFLIHPESVGLESHFTPGVHYGSYKRHNFRNLKQVIHRYLHTDVEARERMKQAGFEHCGSEHTYTMRAKTLLEKIERAGLRLVSPATAPQPPALRSSG